MRLRGTVIMEITLTFDREDGYSLCFDTGEEELLLSVSDAEATQLAEIGIKLV